MIIKFLIEMVISILCFQLYSVLNIVNNEKICYRKYPTQNFILHVDIKCKNNPLSYSALWNESFYGDFINYSYLKNKVKKGYLFFTIVDNNSFKYILNLYQTYLIPYSIYSLVTIVFENITFLSCLKYHIFCIKIKWPNVLNILKTSYKMKVWFMKYILLYKFIKHNISVLYIDSDVIFIQNCLNELIKRNEDIVLLKSQSAQVLGNAGIVYILLKL